MHFRLLGTNGFHAKEKNKRFIAAGSRCRQNLKNENFLSSFVKLGQKIAPKSVPHVQHDYFSSLIKPIISMTCGAVPIISTRGARSKNTLKIVVTGHRDSDTYLIFSWWEPIRHFPHFDYFLYELKVKFLNKPWCRFHG